MNHGYLILWPNYFWDAIEKFGKSKIEGLDRFPRLTHEIFILFQPINRGLWLSKS